MSISTGVISSTGSDVYLTDVKNAMIAGGCSLVSDTGTTTTRVIILSHPATAHNVKLYGGVSNSIYMALLKLDGVTEIAGAVTGGSAALPTWNTYKVVSNGTTFALFIHGCLIFLFTKAGTNKICGIRNSLATCDYIKIYAETADTRVTNYNGYFYFTDFVTASGKQLLIPAYGANNANVIYDNPADNIFCFANVNALAEGTTVTIDTAEYVVFPWINSGSIFQKQLIKAT